MRKLIACTVLAIALSILIPAASASSTSGLSGGYSNYTTQMSGNINETFSFLIKSYNATSGEYTVQQNLGPSSSTVTVFSSDLYKAFPVLSTSNAQEAVKQVSLSPLNSYGYASVIENNSNASLESSSAMVTVPAGTFNAMEFTDNVSYTGNSSFTTVYINCFIDSSTGVILTMNILVNSNGTLLSSSSELMSSNIAQKAESGWNIALIVAGAGVATVSVFIALYMLQKKK